MEDMQTDPENSRQDIVRVTRVRSGSAVPLMREGEVIGVLVLGRLEANSFVEREIALLETFADQAVIAIENTRLFEAEQASKRELQESLEYQTATSEVLNVISRSPTELQPVLDAIAVTAARLCESMDATVWRVAGGMTGWSARFGPPAAHPDALRGGRRQDVPRDRKTLHVHELDAMVRAVPDAKRTQQRFGTARCWRALLSQGEALGAISVR